eukprot:TRINITY_DN70323_c0_g1_i1.p1 TRINITY_DN70323_c0_g1~~TRINITY_DN70323_c0_g1_i1.p1  ORF type:complete len:435 (+),score=113.55 TRINITY_DN70323_c0_g1_i1:76-1305(+)
MPEQQGTHQRSLTGWVPRDLQLLLLLSAFTGFTRLFGLLKVPRWVTGPLYTYTAASSVFGVLMALHVIRVVFNRVPPRGWALARALWKLVTLLRPAEALWRLLTAPLRCRPDVMILGEVRCGTTSVAAHMSQFPGAHGPFCPWSVGFADGKESFYFVGHYCGLVHPLFYRMCFPFVWQRWAAERSGKPFFCYDACAQYFSAPWAPRLIKAACPEASFVVCLRCPTDQNVSWWRFEHGSIALGDSLGLGQQWVEGRKPPATIIDALHAGNSRTAQQLWERARKEQFLWILPDWAATWPGGQLSALAHLGNYAANLRWWQQHFPRERFRVVELAQLSGPELPRTLERVAELLPARCRPPAGRPVPDIRANASASVGPKPTEEEVEKLRQFYRPFRGGVEQLTGTEYPHWAL